MSSVEAKVTLSVEEREIPREYSKQSHRTMSNFIYHALATFMNRSKKFDNMGVQLGFDEED